jgi:hypothetical protein
MSDETPRLHLAQLVSLQELNAVTWNEALAQLDALVDLCLLGQYVNTPPAGPSDGDAYLIGGAPTGTWSGYAYKIAARLDGAWRFHTPFNGLRAYVTTTGAFIVYLNGTWTDWNSLISASETSIASAATCDLGAAGSLFVQITGNTAITSFGTGTNKLRFVRFAQGLTLTHNATSLVLLGGANRTTAAGDVGVYASDASGNWRERGYFRAGVNPGDVATKSGAETLANKTLSSPAFSGTASGFKSTGFTDNAAATGLSIDSSNRVIFGPGGVGAEAFVTYNCPSPYGGKISTFTNGADCNLEFYLTPAGAAVPWSGIGVGTVTPFLFCAPYGGEFARFDTGLNFLPGSDNSRTLGSAARRWSVIYAGTGTINTSGAAEKSDARTLSEAELAVAKALSANVRVFRFCDALANKGDGARLHAGMIYEDVVAAFEAEGLDPLRYGIVCRDPADADKWVLGLRYGELAQFVIAGLAARVGTLEGLLTASAPTR